MSKRNKIIYWIATIWLSLGMVSTGGAQIFGLKTGAGGLDSTTLLGFPVYIVTLIGILKIAGVIAILVPKFPVVKEWAYAGFIFIMTGAIYSHAVTGYDMKYLIPSLLLVVLTALSWYFRPDDKKVAELRAANS